MAATSRPFPSPVPEVARKKQLRLKCQPDRARHHTLFWATASDTDGPTFGAPPFSQPEHQSAVLTIADEEASTLAIREHQLVPLTGQDDGDELHSRDAPCAGEMGTKE